MHFNLFGGEKKFSVVKDSPIHVDLSNQYARKKVSAQTGHLYRPDYGSRKEYDGLYRQGTLILPAGTDIELLGYTMPMYETAFCIKMKLNFTNTGTKLGTFYLYTNIKSLENIDLEPCK